MLQTFEDLGVEPRFGISTGRVYCGVVGAFDSRKESPEWGALDESKETNTT